LEQPLLDKEVWQRSLEVKQLDLDWENSTRLASGEQEGREFVELQAALQQEPHSLPRSQNFRHLQR
jgi:hypothetical protein